MHAHAANVYRRVDLESAPKPQILDRLFARFLADVDAARAAIQHRDIAAKAAAIDHGTQIVGELRASLDHAMAPELCANLDALYGFVAQRLGFASLSLDVSFLDQAVTVMADLRAAFAAAASPP